MQSNIEYIEGIENFPLKLCHVIEQLTPEQLQYTVVTWNVAMNIHHMVDSHMNSYVRIKLALSENNLTIKPYNESAWSTLPDYSSDVKSSLTILDGIHSCICIVLNSLESSDWERTFVHPELSNRKITLKKYLDVFTKHGKEH